MNYSSDQFLRLMEEVEEQGGEHLDELCTARRFEFCGDKIKPVTLPGCGNSSVFQIPYAATDKNGREKGMQDVKVCAVDDALGYWPRFIKEVRPDE